MGQEVDRKAPVLPVTPLLQILVMTPTGCLRAYRPVPAVGDRRSALRSVAKVSSLHRVFARAVVIEVRPTHPTKLWSSTSRG